jgi:hypothetical protein
MKHSKAILNLIFSLTTLLIGCGKPKDPQYIKMVNKSQNVVDIELQYNYPDTLILDSVSVDHVDTIGPNITRKAVTNSLNRGWKSHISHLNSHNTIMVFFYSPDTLKKYSWEKIRQDYKVLKRYDLTTDQLEQMDWTVTYP